MLKNKVVVITGGAGLLGREFSRSVLLNNGKVIIADINTQKAEKVSSQLILETGNKFIEAIELDITSRNSISELIEYVSGKYNKIDAWVNNAYTVLNKNKEKKREYGNSFFDLSYDDFIQSTGMNIGGVFLCSQQIIEFFRKQGYGNIINIASIYGVVPPRFEIYEGTKMTMPVDYAISKSAIIQFTKYLAKFLRGHKIRVNSLSPGGVLNNQPKTFIQEYSKHSLNKGMLDTNDLSGTILFLISDHSQYINGQNIIVDDGWTL